MAKRIKLIGASNWETITFLRIRLILGGNRPYFSATGFMKDIDWALKLLALLGHKERPQQPEATLRRTLQNLRDKGYIEFLGRGEYKLTKNGLKRMEEEYERTMKALTVASNEGG
jgi:hypothetical protein